MCVSSGLWWSVHEHVRFSATKTSVSAASLIQAEQTFSGNEPHCGS